MDVDTVVAYSDNRAAKALRFGRNVRGIYAHGNSRETASAEKSVNADVIARTHYNVPR
jgi:hypothetical protein